MEQLHALLAVERVGSFAAAGRALDKTTGAISYAIGALEEHLNIELLDRSGHRVKLNDKGHRILDEARKIISQVETLESTASDLKGAWESRLRVVVDGIFPQAQIMEAFRHIKESGSATRIELWVEYLDGVVERFTEMEADIMLVLDYRQNTEHVACELPPITMVLVCKRDHALAECRMVTPQMLEEHVELIVEDSRRGGSKKNPRLALGSKHIFRLSDFSSKKRALLSGVGFGWMPKHLVAGELDNEMLIEIPLEQGGQFSFRPHLVHRHSQTLGRAATLFRQRLIPQTG